MEKRQKRCQQEAGYELPGKQQKVERRQEENNNNENEHSSHAKFLESHQAFEIFSALPIAHQHRMLPLWRSIYHDHPIPHDWTRWKIFEWSANRWNPRTSAQPVQFTSDGLNFNMASTGNQMSGYVVAFQGVEFPLTQMDGPQICYYEAKHIKGDFCIGFSTRNPYNSFVIEESGQYRHYLNNERARYNMLPNVAPILDDEITTIGCGLFKHLGRLKIFFTKNEQLLAKPILLPSTTPNELFPIIFLCSVDCRFEDTNFGLKPFQFKYKGNEEKLAEEIAFD